MTKIKQKTFFRNKIVTKKYLTEILFWSFRNYGMARACFLADNIKKLGFQYATQAGISINIEDLKVPTLKTEFIDKANLEMQKADIDLSGGKITEVERYQQLTDNWNMTSEKLKDQVVNYLKNCDPLNPIYLMSSSGARGNLSQVRQLVGMRGLMAGPTGDIIDIPITKNFREGLSITDYMISAYGARKGLVDTALKTADAGYLTRRLIDVAQDILIRQTDCYTNQGIFLFKLNDRKGKIVELKDRLLGRILAKDIIDFQSHEIIGKRNQQVNFLLIKKIEKHKLFKVLVRSPLTCELSRSICKNCYGWNLSNGKLVDLGESIGIIAAQSIGEPGTQLTMRTFHTGGIFKAEANYQVFSKVSGQVFFPKNLKTFPIRTAQGKNALSLEFSSNIEVVNFKNQVSNIFLNKDTILFVKNKEFIKKDQIIASLPETLQSFEKRGKKVLYSKISGEIFLNNTLNNFKQNDSKISSNGLIWVLAGNIFNLPFYTKITKNQSSTLSISNSIASTKFISYKSGRINISFTKNKSKQNEEYKIHLLNEHFRLKGSKLYVLKNIINKEIEHNCVIKLNPNKFFRFTNQLKFNLEKTVIIGKLLNTNFRTNVSGVPYFLKLKTNLLSRKSKTYDINQGGGIFFLVQETFIVNKDMLSIFVENGSWVESNTELANNIYNKNSGFVQIVLTNNMVTKIIIKPGCYITIPNSQIDLNLHKKIIFKGEKLFDTHTINQLTYTEIIKNANSIFLLLRPVFLYELPKKKQEKKSSFYQSPTSTRFDVVNYTNFKNKNNLLIRKNNSINLIQTNLVLTTNANNLNDYSADIWFLKNQENGFSLECNIFENIIYNNYLPKDLDLRHVNMTVFVRDNQYIEPYTILGNLEILPRLSGRVDNLKERKHYKFRRILIRLENTYKNLFTEDKKKVLIKNNFITSGNLISKNLLIPNSGFIKQNNLNHVKFNLLNPFLFSEGAEVFWYNNDFIKEHESLGVLFYKKTQTGDIVQGLPKIEEILEAIRAKTLIKTSKYTGLVLNKLKNTLNVIFITKSEFKFYLFSNKEEIYKNAESLNTIGQPRNSNSGNPHTRLNYLNNYYKNFLDPYKAAYRSLRKTQSYLLNSIQGIYSSQGVSISDKHLEIIIKQMTSKVKIKNRGNSSILEEEYIDLQQANNINSVLNRTKSQELTYQPVLLGITKASLTNKSFISSSSFQETIRILSKAAIFGKVDWLRGLKENVIIGRLIPAGTGFNNYEHISHLNIRLPKKLTTEVF